MPIRSLELTNFTAFRKAKLELSPGVNVFLGENATGKTHAMKALYAMASASIPMGAAVKVKDVLRPEGDTWARLIHRPGTKTAGVRITDTGGRLLGLSYTTRRMTAQRGGWKRHPAVFVGSRELLASFEGFAALYTKREVAFDETYYDLAVALEAPLLRQVPAPLKELIRTLEHVVGGKVVLEGGRFHIKQARGAKLEAALLSEGLRKIATIVRLLQNGSIQEGGLVCWDEPEANLNPKLTVLVAETIASLAKSGVQVVLATHDYLLSETLSLLQQQARIEHIRYFAFVRKGDAVEVTGVDDLRALPENPIRAEYLAHYDRMRAAE